MFELILRNHVPSFQDLLYIVEKQGFPGPGRTMYLFNGDFVDRGKYGVEVMTLLVAFKVYVAQTLFKQGFPCDSLARSCSQVDG